MAKKNNTISASGGRGNTLLLLMLGVLAVLLFIIVVVFARKALATETYYELAPADENGMGGTAVLAKQLITPDMLVPVTTRAGSKPANAIDISEIETGMVRAKYYLPPGEVITKGNAGAADNTLHNKLLAAKYDEMSGKNGGEKIEQDEYENWVLTSISVDADNAMGGRIGANDYFDMLVVGETGAVYPFINIKAIDATVSLDGASSAQAAETSEAHEGQTQQYVLKVTPNQAAMIQYIMNVSGGGSAVQLLLNDKSDVLISDAGDRKVAETGGVNKYDGYGKIPGIESTCSVNLEDEDYPCDKLNSGSGTGIISDEILSNRAREVAARNQASGNSDENNTNQNQPAVQSE